MTKAFRCDKCGKLIEDEVPALYPNLATGYSGEHHIRIEVYRTGSKGDACEPCVRKIAAQFLEKAK